MDQQPEKEKFDNSKVNRYFLRSLETARIPNKNWHGFITSLGSTWSTISTHKLYAHARTYYNTMIMSQKKAAIDASNQALIETPDNLRAFATHTDRYGPVPRLHLPPFNAPTGPRNQQYRPNIARPNYNSYNGNNFRPQPHQLNAIQRWLGPVKVHPQRPSHLKVLQQSICSERSVYRSQGQS
jgi:hypothetical protein